MSAGVTDLLALFGSAPLTHLEVVGDSSTVETETWTALFRAFPSLVSLEADADSALFDGLYEASCVGPGLYIDADEPVACSGLARLDIHDHWVGLGRLEWVLDPLIRCLRCRSGRGTRLEVLHVDLHVDADRITSFLPQLEDLVPKVEVESACTLVYGEALDKESEESGGEGSDGSVDEELDASALEVPPTWTADTVVFA